MLNRCVAWKLDVFELFWFNLDFFCLRTRLFEFVFPQLVFLCFKSHALGGSASEPPFVGPDPALETSRVEMYCNVV